MNIKAFVLPVVLLILLLSLFACSNSSVTPISGLIATNTTFPTATETATILPTHPPTPSATPVPAIIPTLRFPLTAGTAFPTTAAVISAENLRQIQPLMTWGDGSLVKALLSPDQSLLAFRGSIGVTLFDVKTLTVRSRIVTGAEVTSMAFSSDGKQLAVGLATGKVQLFNPASGIQMSEYFKVLRAIETISFGPDSLVVYQYNFYRGEKVSNTHIWQLSTGNLVFASEAMGEVSPIISPDGKLIVVRGGTGYQVLSTQDGKPAWKSPGGIPKLFSPDSRLLVFSVNGQNNFYNTTDGKLIHALTSNGVLQFTPDSQHVLAFEGNRKTGSASLFFLPEGKTSAIFERAFNGFPYPIQFACSNCTDVGGQVKAAISPDGKFLALGTVLFQDWDQKNSIRLYRMDDGSLIREIPLLTGENGYFSIEDWPNGQKKALYPGIQDIFFVDSGNSLVTLETSGQRLAKLRKWDVVTGKTLASADLRDVWTDFIGTAFSPDGKSLATSRKTELENLIQFRSLASGTVTGQIAETYLFQYGFTLRDLTFIFQGKAILTNVLPPSTILTLPDGKAKLEKEWDCDARADYNQVPAAFSPDGKFKVCADNQYLDIVEIATGKMLQRIPSKGVWGYSDVKFSPDGKQLAISFSQKETDVFDLATGQQRFSLMPGDKLAYSADGRMLVVLNNYWGYYFFDAQTGKALHTMYVFDSLANSIAFSPDGTLLATCGDGGITFWGIQQ